MKPFSGTRSSYAANHGIAVLLLLAVSTPLAASQPSLNTDSYNNYAPRFSPTMAIIVVILVAVLFFMAFFSIYILHCSDGSNSASVTAGRPATGRSRRGTRGLDQSVISTFPTLEYSKVKGLKIGKGALECAVCICEFEDDEMLRLIPKCDHVFHPDCIDAWLGSHTTCPVCRANLSPEPGEAAPQIPQLDAEQPTTEPEENREIVDLEVGERRDEDEPQVNLEPAAEIKSSLSRNRTRNSRSSRVRRMFPRSHSTGHSLIQPGQDTERFTLRLPAEVRKQIVNKQLNRAMSMVVLPREGSSRRGYRAGEGSSRGRILRKFDRMARSVRLDRWWSFNVFSKSGSLRSPRIVADHGEGTSTRPSEVVSTSNADRPPV